MDSLPVLGLRLVKEFHCLAFPILSKLLALSLQGNLSINPIRVHMNIPLQVSHLPSDYC